MSEAQVMFGAVSHSPLITIRKRVPEPEARIAAEIAAFRERVEAFQPDCVVMFSNDHFANFYYANMPAFCIGTECEAVDDVGGTPGRLQVPAEDAIALTAYLRTHGFDPAISYNMKVDHGFSQPLMRMFGALDRWPVIPVFISAFTAPFLPFRRSREIGTAVGRFIAASGKRVLVVGSGGVSHHPIRYYPFPADAEPAVYSWQRDGAAGMMTAAEWFDRLDKLHHIGAENIVKGMRTAKEMHLNEEWDRDVLGRIDRGDLASMDEWDQWEIVNTAGVGALEMHNWIAARAAHLEAGGGAVRSSYDLVMEYGVGYALGQSV